MKKKVISILLFNLIAISLIGCGTTTSTNNIKQEEAKKENAKYIAILESGKTYEQMDGKERGDITELIDNWEKQNQEFKNKYQSKKEFIEKSKSEIVAKWKAEEDEKTKESENIPQNVKYKYKAKFGEVLEANKLGKSLTIKFKIKPSYNNKATIHQNGYNVEDLILNQGGDEFDTISYWAVADMQDGSQSKAISFTLDKNLIQSIKNKNIVGNQIVDSAKDVWILPSLKK